MSQPTPRILGATEVDEALANGLIRVQRHPEFELFIFNYTERATYGRAWNEVTRTCRGLIVDATGAVVGRPWPKFFNHGELDGQGLDLDAEVEVTDKADGSLGILYPAGGEYRLATRGSFDSEQARHATEIYRARYAAAWHPDPAWTYLFEIVYPGNRIVLDYQGLDDLILLGAVRIQDGAQAGPSDVPCADWPGPRVEVFRHRSLAAALSAEPRTNAEGLVVRYLAGPQEGWQLKLKQADYLRLHRLLSGLNARTVWELVAIAECAPLGLDDRNLAQQLKLDPERVTAARPDLPDWQERLRQQVPEEFWPWLEATVAQSRADFADLDAKVRRLAEPWVGADRKSVAHGLAGHEWRGLVFAVLDGKPIAPRLWQMVRPGLEAPWGVSAETE